MHYVALPDRGWPVIDATSLVKAAGATSYDRGVRYLREGAVTELSWDRGRNELYGSVRGSTGSCYQTVAYFHPSARSVLEFDQGRCSCPVEYDCKHVVALVLAASQAQLARPAPPLARPAPLAGPAPLASGAAHPPGRDPPGHLGAVGGVMAAAAAGPPQQHLIHPCRCWASS